MIRDYDIFILGQSRWDNPYSSPAFCLAKEFSNKNRVFYIDHPFSIKDYFSQYSSGNTVLSRKNALLYGKDYFRKIDGLPDNFTVIIPQLTLPLNWLSDGFIYDRLSEINDKIVFKTLRKTIKQFDIKSYILINSFDPFFLRNIPKDIKPAINVYQTIDDITQETYIARHGVRLEKEAIKKADCNFATSKELTRLMLRYTKKAFCLPNAADFSLFQKAVNQQLDKPAEIKDITKKVICYTGVIGTRINYELLKKVADFHTDKLLLMVGPLDNDSYKKVGLDTLPNVVFTGSKKITDLPSYLQHSDCAIIPFEYSTLTKSIYPLKINEYLTAGKPVVATAFSEDIKDFKDEAYVAETEEEFVQNIDLAIKEDSPEKKETRIKRAQLNTWEARVNTFWETLESVLKK